MRPTLKTGNNFTMNPPPMTPAPTAPTPTARGVAIHEAAKNAALYARQCITEHAAISAAEGYIRSLLESELRASETARAELRRRCEDYRTLLVRSRGALMGARECVLADRKAEDDRRSEHGAPSVDWSEHTSYDPIITDITNALARPDGAAKH